MSPLSLRHKLRRQGLPIPPDLLATTRRMVREDRRAQARAKAAERRHQIEAIAAHASIALADVLKASPLTDGGPSGKDRFTFIITRALREWMGESDGRTERRRRQQREYHQRRRLRADRLGAGIDTREIT